MTEKDKINSELLSTKEDLVSSQDEFSKVEGEYSDYQDKIERYFSLSLVVKEDSLVVLDRFNDFYENPSQQKINNYESKVKTLIKHINDYTTLISDNKEFFEDLGVGVDNELETADESIEIYETSVEGMKEYLTYS